MYSYLLYFSFLYFNITLRRAMGKEFWIPSAGKPTTIKDLSTFVPVNLRAEIFRERFIKTIKKKVECLRLWLKITLTDLFDYHF